MANQQTEIWTPIIGRALALIALHGSSCREGTLAEKAKFLEGLGLSRKDAAEILGTTSASVTELMRKAKKKRR
jgi:hypothetical protein